MSKKRMGEYFLVTDSTSDEVENRTGLRGYDTPFGVLIEKPKPFRLDVELEKLYRLLNPRRCTCGKYAVIHRSNCPAAVWV